MSAWARSALSATMVSLINFKIVDDDLRCEGDGELVAAAASAAANATASRDGHRRVANSGTPVVASDRQARLLCQSTSDHDALQRRMPRTDNSERIQVSTSSECQQLQQLELTTSSRPTTREKARQTEVANIDRQQECNEMYLKCSCKVAHQQYQDSQHTITSSEHSSRLDHCQQADQCQNYDCHCTSRPSTVFGCNDSGAYESPSNIKHNQDFAHQKAKGSSFTVTWRNLKFAIEPKWHEKIAKKSSSIVALATCRVASTTSKTGPVEGANATEVQITAPTSDSDSSPVSRVVLDQLDGSFRSGQLTAILGPSGKCRLPSHKVIGVLWMHLPGVESLFHFMTLRWRVCACNTFD